MYTIQRFDTETAKLYQQNLIQGAVHSYVGQEAVAVGACSALRQGDYISSTHRGHGHCLAKGLDPKRMLAEILGRRTGYCKGKGGSMHIADLDRGILGANGIVGGGIGVATGAAFTARYKKLDFVSLCFFGDGALHQGIFHECADMASLWKLPVIYLSEYNCFAEFTHSVKTFPHLNLEKRAEPYGFPGYRIDGNDVLLVYKTVKQAVDRARRGEGPALIVATCYRLEGHYIGDPLTYRTREETEEARTKEPVSAYRRRLLKNEIAGEEILWKIEAKVQKTIQEAIDFALSSPEPETDELFTDVYATPEIQTLLLKGKK
ncbi:MAG: thiamine pyrophosphate-dependent dehydrogenase E1 component subunit alpha [Planctomycetes bacterium]|nr:thiamine pyrophosphate-dependent dehydrogenase E1 component subunit alpha [Planctomycetota bacterium]